MKINDKSKLTGTYMVSDISVHGLKALDLLISEINEINHLMPTVPLVNVMK
ncbi:MAG: hypothetical protein WCP85_07150 [Mariniphaga sp.]